MRTIRAGTMAGFGAPGAERSGSTGFVVGGFYGFGRIALPIVRLVPRTGPAWQMTLCRFAEVSIGIAVAVVLTVVLPEREVALPNKT